MLDSVGVSVCVSMSVSVINYSIMPKKVRNLSKLYNLYKNRYLAKCMKLKSALTYSVSGSIQLHLRARRWNRFMRSDHSSFHSNTTELGPMAR